MFQSLVKTASQLQPHPALPEPPGTRDRPLAPGLTATVALGLVACLLLPKAVRAETFQVPSEFPTIQEGVDAAAVGDTVEVAAGTYTGTGNYEIQFRGKDLAVIAPAGPDATIIDCEGQGRGFDIRGGESNAALIQGFTVRNGWARQPTWPGSFAAGISCRGLSHPTVRFCVFEGGSAFRGGAIGCADSSPVVEDCVFKGNQADNDGGAAAIVNFSDPVFVRCVFIGNAAGTGGAIVVDRSNPTFFECTIASNEAGIAGGGVAIKLNSAPGFERVLVSGNCAATGNDVALTLSSSAASFDCSALSDAGLDVGPGSVEFTGGRVEDDPQFCLPMPCENAPHVSGIYGLASTSPCLPGNSPCGLLIGAFGQECEDTAGLPETRFLESSWGQLKMRWRN